MMGLRAKEILDGLPILLAVAAAKSFTRAPPRLGVSPSAASQAVRVPEDRVRTPLLMRSTRSTCLTVAGAAYREKVAPAFAAIEGAAREIMGRASRPAGPLRITMPRAAFDGVVMPVLASFRAAYPDVELEIEVESRLVDIVERGFDAGLRYGTLLAKDVTATGSRVLSRCRVAQRRPAACWPPPPLDGARAHLSLVVVFMTGPVVGPVLLRPLSAQHDRLSNIERAYRPAWGFGSPRPPHRRDPRVWLDGIERDGPRRGREGCVDPVEVLRLHRPHAG